MDEKSLKVLEFDKLLALVAGYASSAPGRELVLRLRPFSSLRHVRALQQNTADARRRLELKGRSLSCAGLRDPSDILTRLSAGASLSAGELLDMKRLLDTASSAVRYASGSEDSLSEIFELLESLPDIRREIEAAVLDEYTLADDASPELARVRRQIKKTVDDIHSCMEQRLRASREYLSDDVITMRDERYCLPVRAEAKSKVAGVVHGSSQTGLTLFIEPMSVVNLNNTLIALRGEEERETERVLMALSSLLMPHVDALREDYVLLQRLDMIFAKAIFAAQTDSAEPVFSKERSIDLVGARHPLIAPGEVVPIDIRLGGEYSVLVVTGPNTGGKTVSLKTLGLLELMALSGLQIPAAPGSVVGIYDNVYADIGDEQSIEQSLSTFSSHMTRIAKILGEADEGSLCLFDELSVGTDPTEGAALGIAILDFLRERGIHTMATTHYAQIKVYAMTTPGVENASTEFDVDSLRPTYRLLIGIPGQSNAFLISRRLGLPESIIEDARRRLGEEERNLEEIIAGLQAERAKARKLADEAEVLRNEALSLRDRARAKEKKLDEMRERELTAARKEARRILRSAKETADKALSDIRKQTPSAEGLRRAEQGRDRLREALRDVPQESAIGLKGPSRPVSPKALKKGDIVRVMSFGGVTGEVTSLPDKDGELMVRMGAMLSRVHVSTLEYPEDERK